jgi:glycosyl transferase family 2
VASAALELIRSELPMRAPAELLADAAERLSRRRPGPVSGVRRAPRGGPRRSAAERLESILEVAATPITRIGGQVKELRLRIDDLSRRLDLLDYKLDYGEAPSPVIDLETRPDGGDAPRVSVLVPVYDYAHVVGDALESVARSTFSDLEVVLVDDGSKDDSVELVRSWMTESQLPAVLVRHPVNRGLPAARNTAIKHARGDYLLMLDADNQIYPQCVERLTAALDEDRDAAFAYGILERFDRTGPIGLRSKFGWSPARLRRGNYIDALALTRRNVLEEVGGYTTDVRLFGWEDYDLWCAIASLGLRGAHVREIVGRYRESPEAMTSVIDLSTDTARSVITKRHPALFGGSPPKSSTIDRIVRQLV